jgi:protein HIRA/HIR1
MDAIMTSKDGRREALPKGGGGSEVSGNQQIAVSARPRIAVDSSVKEVGVSITEAVQTGMGLSSVQREVVVNAEVKGTKGVVSIILSSDEDADDSSPVALEARPMAGSLPDNPETEVICSKCGQAQWKDRLAGKAAVIAGNSNIWAVGCEDGTLQVSLSLLLLLLLLLGRYLFTARELILV